MIFFTSVERIVVVKCLNRASGSFCGERLSIRVNVCLTEIGSGRSVIAPVWVGVTFTRPEVFCICVEKSELISGVMNDDRTIVWRMCRAWLSRYQFRTRLKSHP